MTDPYGQPNQPGPDNTPYGSPWSSDSSQNQSNPWPAQPEPTPTYQTYPTQPEPQSYPPAYGNGGYGAQQGYGAPQPPYGAPQATPYGNVGYGAPPNNNLVWGILTTLLCCLPLGIPSIVFASQVNSKWAAGDYAGAQDSAKKAGQFAMWSAITTVVGLAAYFVLIAMGVIAGSVN